MATNLGSDKKIIEDTPSEIVRSVRTALNEVMDAVISITNAAVTDGNAFQSNVAALDFTNLRKVIATLERPTPPQNPTP